MPPAGFKLTIPASEHPQTYALDSGPWDQLYQIMWLQFFRANSSEETSGTNPVHG